ncbi:TPA: hypothetical protein ACF2D8_005043 [Serratia marcescens]|uniref:hypothetical protein n=1 Tax=Serratia marcescens TaxID=615 RepID=UPI0024C49601|nr:hypothetical protein [Serratia marcescens]MDK1711745.1 hypothetical protein [Serratia marcescens]
MLTLRAAVFIKDGTVQLFSGQRACHRASTGAGQKTNEPAGYRTDNRNDGAYQCTGRGTFKPGKPSGCCANDPTRLFTHMAQSYVLRTAIRTMHFFFPYYWQ